jgi:hypothetical protein
MLCPALGVDTAPADEDRKRFVMQVISNELPGCFRAL